MIDVFLNELKIFLNDNKELYKYHGMSNLLFIKIDKYDNQLMRDRFRNLNYIKETNLISKIFNQYNINHAVLKSMSYITELYSDIAIKTFGDIDILIDISQADLVERVLFDLGYIHGIYDYYEKKIIEPERSELISRTLYSHQLYEFCKVENGVVFNLDINYRFQWREMDDSKIDINILFEENTELFDDGKLKISRLKPLYNFIHMCCHYYNEAVYFMRNEYEIGKDPHELKLTRLVDIVLFLDKNLFSIEDLYNCSKELNVLYKILYCLKIIDIIAPNYLSNSIKHKFNIELVDMNVFYDKNLSIKKWKIDVTTRLKNPSKKLQCLRYQN